MSAPASKLIIPNPVAEFVEKVKKHLDLSGFTVFPTAIICAHFVSNKSAGGIIRPTTNQNEQRWQGKCGLVVALGSEAFKDSADASFYGFKPKIYDWVVYRNSDGHDFDYVIKGQSDAIPCRWIKDGEIEMITPDPSLVY